jgi:predicted flap endonuclease-1-like 5' DNA nuclease
MSDNSDGWTCTATCWGIAALAGILAAAVLMVLGGWSFLQATFIGIVFFVIGGAIMQLVLCRSLPAPKEAAVPVAGSAAQASAQPAAVAPTAAKTAVAGAAVAASVATAASAKTAKAPTAAKAKPKANGAASKTPAGIAATGATTSKAKTTKAASAKATATKAPAKAAAKAGKAPTAKAAPKAAAKTATKAATTTKAVPKAAAAKAAKPKAAAKTATASKAAARKPVAADGQPEVLKKARASGADDLKQIKGVGPGLEKTLNELGFYHFDQVAGWRKKEVEWVDSRLKFKGRIERDEWIKQCKVLAKGGTTEFSKKVKKGGVY